MKKLALSGLLALTATIVAPTGLVAQDQAAFLEVGEMAPDITVAGATRHGVLAEDITLGSLRGETVVIAFFFKVRTGG
jgi:hypothetical protein